MLTCLSLSAQVLEQSASSKAHNLRVELVKIFVAVLDRVQELRPRQALRRQHQVERAQEHLRAGAALTGDVLQRCVQRLHTRF